MKDEIKIVVLPVEELETLFRRLFAEMMPNQVKKQESPVSTTEMKRLLNIKDHRAFRRRVKFHNAKKQGKIGREDSWLPSSFNIAYII